MSANRDSASELGLDFFGNMTASISHELKNALAIVNENAGLLGDLRLSRSADLERLVDVVAAVCRSQLAAIAGNVMVALPVAIAVSCSADRQCLAKITPEGVFIEQLEFEPGHFLPEQTDATLVEGHEEAVGASSTGQGAVVPIDLNRPMAEILAELSKHPVKTRLSLTGPLVVARDIAHAKIKERLDAGEEMPAYLKDHPVYYAGPAKTPEGMPSGSFGPTTAGRMDSYVDQFQAAGGSMVMLAKGNRSKAVTDACKAHGGFYLGSIGGPAARLAQDCIKAVDVLEYPELGMEAIWRIEVEDFPAFIVVDDKGEDFFASVTKPMAMTISTRPGLKS